MNIEQVNSGGSAKTFLRTILVYLSISFFVVSGPVLGDVEKLDLPKDVISLLTKAKATGDKEVYLKAVTLLFDLYPLLQKEIFDRAISISPERGEDIKLLRPDLIVLTEKNQNTEMPEPENKFILDNSDFFTFEKWEGKVELGFGSSSGNTNVQAFTGGFEASRNFKTFWQHNLSFDFDFAKANSLKTQERFSSDYQLHYLKWNKKYVFGLATFEYDKFSGFDYRLTQAVGVGYNLIGEKNIKWSVEGGAGARENKPKNVILGLPSGKTELTFIGILNSNFRYWIQPDVSFGVHLKTAWGSERFTLSNVADIKAKIKDRFSGKVSFEAKYDSNVPLGTKKKDTLMKATLVVDF